MQSDEDAVLEIEDPLDIRRTPGFFFGEQRVLYGENPSNVDESSVLVENKFIRANLVTIGILLLVCIGLMEEWIQYYLFFENLDFYGFEVVSGGLTIFC